MNRPLGPNSAYREIDQLDPQGQNHEPPESENGHSLSDVISSEENPRMNPSAGHEEPRQSQRQPIGSRDLHVESACNEE